jgi:phosphoenolpyruvate---glycerone phosphotransferase subunit DhaL
MITEKQIRRWIAQYHDDVASHADELNKLDAALGDGDFGASMHRGLDAVVAQLDEVPTGSIGAVLRNVGTTFVSAIGGTSGPLVGSFFLKAGIAIGDVAECDDHTLASGLRVGASAVSTLGGAELGDKTMIDALLPALDAMDAAIRNKEPFVAVATIAAAAASTKARKGRASYVGDGGTGHVDAGAQGIAVLFRALAAASLETHH